MMLSSAEESTSVIKADVEDEAMGFVMDAIGLEDVEGVEVFLFLEAVEKPFFVNVWEPSERRTLVTKSHESAE